MATLYESYTTGYTGDAHIYGATWVTQTFTPTTSHSISSVKLYTYRVGSPGTITVSIRATDANKKPTGSDLTSGTINGNTLPVSIAWNEITLTAYNLLAGVRYAIVFRAPSGSVNNELLAGFDGTSPTYTNGDTGTSYDSGATWSLDTTSDYLFEDWGDPTFVPQVIMIV